MESLFHGRMDWGLGNPNKTAALIASLMLAVWLLAYVRKWGFWLALSLLCGLGACLVLTLSRGGIAGGVVGGLVILVWTPRPYPLRRVIGLALVCAGLVGFACLVNEQSRMMKGLSGDDLSVENRLLIWKQVPSMIHDAPDGWPQAGVTCPRLVLLSPRPPDSPKVMQWLISIPQVTVIVGEYSQNKDFWNEQSKSHPNIKVQVVDGMEDYLSNWAHQVALAVADFSKVDSHATNK